MKFLFLVIILFTSFNLNAKNFHIWKNNENSQPNIEIDKDKKTDYINVNNFGDILKKNKEPDGIEIFRKSYPDVIFKSEYKEAIDDWKIYVEIPDKNSSEGYRKSEFYWAKGSLLPESELNNKDNYWSLLYQYDYHNPLPDPADYTPEQIKEIKSFTTDDNRKNGAGTPMFFFFFFFFSLFFFFFFLSNIISFLFNCYVPFSFGMTTASTLLSPIFTLILFLLTDKLYYLSCIFQDNTF